MTPALTIPAAFAEQARSHGGRPAVIDGGRVLSYQELDEQSGRVAGVIRGGTSADGPVVAILAAHGVDLILALVAVVRAGTPAVVLDPADPPRRLRELLDEAEVGCVLADAIHASLAADLVAPRTRVIRIEEALAARGFADSGVLDQAVPGSIAFILFTSGSTGKPKGVLATHSNIVLNVRNYALSAELGPEDRLTLVSRVQFMAGVSAVFAALLNGAAVLPFDVRARGFRELRDWLIAERITLYHSVPTLFRRFCETLTPEVRFASVRIVKLGGEPVMHHDLKLWQRHFGPSSVLINGLGLSEANGNLCHFKIRHGEAAGDSVVPVGRPLPGVEIRLLDDLGGEVAIGGVGEIAFRCPHRAPGYWRSHDFASRLVQPPLGDGSEPYFRTGDLGRLRPDGCLEHLGRKDDLIKMRGLRIEPAQVEAALLEDPRVRQCAVGVRGGGSQPQHLVAWVVTNTDASLTPEDMRRELARRLPAALIPSVFTRIDALPMTPGGKTDRKALPDPVPIADAPATGTEAPRDALELALARLWRKLLRVGQVSPSDDFFALGGDSLTAAVLLTKVEEVFRTEVELSAFLAAPTPRELARLIRESSKDPRHRRLVLMRRGSGGTPFFFVPGAGAVGRDVSPVAEVGPRPHYRLQYRGLDGVELPLRSVSEMAAYFLGELRKVQPAGPYLLGGGSFGALVALEAAHRLTTEGESVQLLVVEDPLLDGCLVPRMGGPWHHRLERSLLWLMPVGKRFALTWRGVRAGLRQWRYRLMVPWARWRAQRLQKPLPKVYRFHDLLNHSLAAKRDYALASYHGPVVLMRSRFTAAHRLFALDPTLGWSRLCPQLHTIELEGEKGEHDTDPRTQPAYLARLDAVLDAAESR